MYKIILVTSGQPALNPRLVKEADALADNGYDVTVLFAYWNNWGGIFTKKLLASKKWKAISVGGDPVEKPLVYFFSRVIYHMAKLIVKKFGTINYFTELAVSRSSFFLMTEVKKHKADLYIAHNLGALAPVIKAAKKNHAKCGFDAEDLHRNEVSDDNNNAEVKLRIKIEAKYISKLDYMTASSPQIADVYSYLFNKATIILNVFPKIKPFNPANNIKDNLRLFWFSQTIGPNRGLETIIEAINITGIKMELHLLGSNSTPVYQSHLVSMAQSNQNEFCELHFHDAIYPDELFNTAPMFDIGLASEPGFCLNNKLALSNKLFTYIQCGLAIIASDTIAQKYFLNKYPEVGKLFNNAYELAETLIIYHNDRELLQQTKEKCFQIGQTVLNWETESMIFMDVIKEVVN